MCFRDLRAVRAVMLGLLLALSAPLTPLSGQGPPSPQDVLGWGMGERFTDVNHVNRYMEALAEASGLVSVERYGETHEGRPLIQVLVATPGHRQRLDEILAENRELVDPSTSAERAADIISRNPAVVYFSYGVHGNESSSSEAAMWTTWDLARGADDVAGVLDSLIVILDPVVNPDGRDRYVSWYKRTRGKAPNPDPRAREHREPWPGGRYNHYLFDLNRDWTWMTQVETRTRLATWDRWNPQVHVDFHEMFHNSSYFFFPATPPINPIYPDHILEWGRRFGEGNAEVFDENGWLYYTAESFDLFYPGYGDSWPALNGAIGMTYEQAGHGFGGLAVERDDGTVLTLHDRALHHRTSGKATLRTAAQGKTDLVSGFAAFHRNVDEGLPDILLVPGDRPRDARALVDALRSQGIAVDVAGEGFRADARVHQGYLEREDFPVGTYLIRARQPRGKLALTLLRPEVVLDAQFSYDISAWSLPYAYGVEAHSVDEAPSADWRRVSGESSSEPEQLQAAPYGYLVEPGFAPARALIDFLEGEGRAYVVQDTFTLAGQSYPRGTVFLPRGRNGENLDARVRDSGLGAYATPVTTGWTEGGPDLGTNEAAPLKLPRIALLGGDGTTPTSYGAHWYFLEQELDAPFDALNVEDVGSLDLSEYDVVLVPSGFGIRDRLGDRGFEGLQDWIRAGGVLIAVNGAARALAEGLAEVKQREESEEEEDIDRDERLERALRTRKDREEDRWRQGVPGTILRVRLDPRHPLSFGAGAGSDGDGMFVLTGGDAFEPDEDFESVAWFEAGTRKVSGLIYQESLDRMERSTWLLQKRVGRGKVILFADDPLFRMFWYSGFQPLTNALLLGPVF